MMLMMKMKIWWFCCNDDDVETLKQMKMKVVIEESVEMHEKYDGRFKESIPGRGFQRVLEVSFLIFPHISL